MSTNKRILTGVLIVAIVAAMTPPATAQQTTDAQTAPPPAAQAVAAPAADSVPPPSAPPKLGAAELEKLVGPIALYPDPLIATILPASVYPLEIVQAARFVADTNNLAKLDEQPWDDNVKALARIPAAIKKLNDDLPWTIQLGEAFLAQDKDLMDAIQAMRLKADKAGTLRTTEQQIVVVTNTVVQTVVQQQAVVVTNTIVQIVPANPEIIYVPQYNPTVVYYPPPTYVYSPYDPLITFGAGFAMGVIVANSCNWYHGGCYHGYYGGSYNGGHNTKIKIEGDVNIGSGNTINRGNRPTPYSDQGQKWQPDQSRLNRSGSAGATSARSQEARGWGSGAGASTGAVGARPSTGAVGARPSTGTAGARPSTGTVPSGNRPSAGTGPDVVRGSPSSAPSANRPSTTPSVGQSGTRPSTPSASARPTPSQGSVSRPSPSTGGGNNAFSGVGSGASARQSSSRGSMSRGGGGGRGGGGRGR